MVTDRYQHLRHHAHADDLAAWAQDADIPLIGVDNLPGARPLERSRLPRVCVLVFGQEGPGLSESIRRVLTDCRSIAQFGSTRSINAGVASGIAMHTWISQHALDVPSLSAH
jgi:tRNA G18 (ribose-2'-O)-methylase SpoU